MTRTDKRGRSLKAFVIAEIVGNDVTVEQLLEAVGVKRSRWYGDSSTPGRSNAEDFPDPTELLNLATYFKLGDDGYLNLLAEFGWISPGGEVQIKGFTQPHGGEPATGVPSHR